MPPPSSSARIFVHDATASPWVAAGKPGLYQKLVRGDAHKGEFLGLLAFDSLVSSGLHQHTGVTTSYMLSGSLTDYWGTYREGVTGINIEGSTHDAICYSACSMVNRLEAPVLYPQDFALHSLHHGSRHGAFENPAPEAAPTIAVDVARLAAVATPAAGVVRRTIYDHGSADRRHVCLSVRPRTKVPPYRVGALTELFVLAGQVVVNGLPAGPANFVVLEPDTEVSMSSEFGCTLLAWADGPTAWLDQAQRPDLYGF